jgi:predicted nucleic-acid-binding Zn-ribbon protein
METQFIYCSKCGTRNFADDKICGVCKSKLSSATNSQDKNQSTPKISGCAWIIIISLAVLGYTTFFGEDNKKSSASKERIFNSEWDASVQQVEEYLKNSYLKDPDSYKSISWSEVFKLNDTKQVGFASYQVRHKYSAKNSFGGYVIEEKLFKLDYQGNILDVQDYRY